MSGRVSHVPRPVSGDVDAQRFYARHGFTDLEPDTGERAVYLHRRLVDK